MQTLQTATTESAIWSRLLEPANTLLSPAAARSILRLDFSEEDKKRMHVLAEKAREGTLTPAEHEAIENYERVGNLLALMQSKARLYLKKASIRNAL
jgi:SpoU rRNA methylase family enzyme